MLQPRLISFLLSLAVAEAGALQPPAAKPTGAFLLDKRQDCPVNFYSCAAQGDEFQNLCCADGWVCTKDADDDPACCPSNAVCTGSIPEPTGISYVINDYFTFPYIRTSFSNAGVCSAYVNQCTSNYEVCTANLEGLGGEYAVTIAVPGGGGTTVAGASVTLPSSSAESICSSLSSEACFGIQSSVCEQTGAVGVFVVSAAPLKTTPASFSLLVAGVAAALVKAIL